jgi:DNA polymerase-3 subunit delta'
MQFRMIKGHQRQIRILKGTIQKNRVPSTLLFSGDSGIGKRTTAMVYFQALNCLERQDGDACDTCISCRKISKGSHPDLLLIQPERGEIRIEMIRSIEEFLSMKPFESRKKVVLIDDAETMNISAANAFLKTLEEPPAESVILLVSTNADNLLDTIKSRCFHVRFSPLPRTAYREVLETAGMSEIDNATMNLTMGRPGLAITGSYAVDMQRCIELYRAMMRGESKDLWENREDMLQWLAQASVVFRDLAVLAGDTGQPLVFQAANGVIPFESAIQQYQAIEQVIRYSGLNLNKGITWQYVSEIVRNGQMGTKSREAE